MSRIPNRESGLAHTRMEYERAILYAQWWIASATTGHALNRRLSRGREPTQEERERGQCVGWVPLTDQEKINDAMNTAEAHMDRARKLQDVILCYLNDNPESLRSAQESLYRS